MRPLFIILAKKNKRPTKIAGRPAALPQNCLTTEGKSRTALSVRPRHFSNNSCRVANISFRHNRLASAAT
jgi:hypothetical protein